MTITDAFWKREQKILVKLLTPLVLKAALKGAQNSADDLEDDHGIGVDFSLVNESVKGWAGKYTFDLVSGITDTTRDVLQRELTAWIESGAPLPDLVQALEDTNMFSPERAERIGVTESTRAFAEGNKATWKEGGISQFIFRTAEDELVCPECGPNADKVFDMDDADNTPPLHTNCRCFLAPVVESENE